jgi:Asp/Glu/hydantoin racemase
MPDAARLVLIHALKESIPPISAAFAAGWPEAQLCNLVDDSLSTDLAAEGRLTPAMVERFLTLGRYAAASAAAGRQTSAILFTCSAFGPAIEAVQRALTIPVLKPNEAAFEQALDAGRRIGILVTFPPSLPALEAELRAMAAARGIAVEITGRVAEGALQALQAGDEAGHDRLAAAAAARLPPLDALVLGQFTLARAASAVAAAIAAPVLTTPDTAVAKLKARLAQ